jgi:hypothetical protein
MGGIRTKDGGQIMEAVQRGGQLDPRFYSFAAAAAVQEKIMSYLRDIVQKERAGMELQVKSGSLKFRRLKARLLRRTKKHDRFPPAGRSLN